MSSFGPPPPSPEDQGGEYYVSKPTKQQSRVGVGLTSGFIGLAIGVAGSLGGVALFGEFDDERSSVAEADETSSPSSEPEVEPADETTAEEPTPSEPARYEPTVDDFDVETSIKEQTCFGSAGCNVTLRTEPVYLGTEDPTGVWEVTYEITGIEDGPMIRTFDLDGEEVSFDTEARVQVPERDTDIQVEITEVREGFSYR
jgi:hypothetical protein